MRGTASGGRMLWETLGEIPDRRGKKGRQYPLRSVLVLTLAAMLAGANDLRAIFRWGRRLPKEALYLLGIRRAPCHAMYHYFFKALDVAAVEQVLGAWARGAAPPGHVAIDGKRLRQRGGRPRRQSGRASARRLALSREIAYAITSLPRGRAGPDDLLALVRQHWSIENRLHYRRDVALREDASRIRSGNAPQARAALRNTVLRLVDAMPGPLTAIRETLAENRLDAIALEKQGSL